MQKFLYSDLYNLEDKHWWHLAKRKLVRSMLTRTLSDNKNKILDIGCGTGKNLEMLAAFGQTWGIDASAEALRFCRRRRLPHVSVQSAIKTNFADQSFDLVTMLDVLEHIDERRALKEAYRILKPGGKILITVPSYSWLWSQWDVILKHKRRYTKSQLTAALMRQGFTVSRCAYFHSFLVLPTLIVRLVKSRLSRNHYSSDFGLSNGLVNTFFALLANIERPLILAGLVPFGLSLVCLANKKKTAYGQAKSS